MASCKDCLGFEFCLDRLGTTKYYDNGIGAHNVQELCQKFKDRTRFVELPCKVGDTVYVIENNEIIEDFVDQIGIGYYCDGENIYQMDGIKTDWYFSDIGKTVFLTREEAERALKERENNG